MARITSGSFAGPVGRLEYILSEPDANASPPRHAAVVCHPHPLFGGTMHTKVVFQTAQVMLSLGMPVLRFNYRGVGKSQGSYDHGRGEQRDLAAAMTYLREQYPLPLVLGGFSFGATMVAKTLAAASPREVVAAVLLGLPVDSRDRDEIPTDWAWQGPKLLISGAQDQFASVGSLENYFAALAPPKRRDWIPGADHFMTGQMEAFREGLRAGLIGSLS
ncbi:MAG: alpha/beta hydrolase [Terriglobales bacterium]